MRNSFRNIIPLALIVTLAACGGGGSAPTSGTPTPSPTPTPTPAPTPTPTPTPAPTPPPSVERDVDPALTNAAITTNLLPNFVINPAQGVTARGKLFVMLPGTGANPGNYRLIVRTGAQSGYHAIGLTYVNDNGPTDLCAGNPAADCTSNIRREVITGEDTSTLVSVNPANSIVGRLTALLTYMSITYPTEGWGQYLAGGRPDWSKITIAGHSQGAGHAAYFAKLQNLDRTVMFDGPGDLGPPGQIAPWLDLPNLTPASRQYGFTHVADQSAPFALVTAEWGRLGLNAFGAVTSVDGASPPFGNTRTLSTNATPAGGGGPASMLAHTTPVVDVATPLDASGVPIFRPVWIYLAFS